jgi:SAM-dependent methyltransferase
MIAAGGASGGLFVAVVAPLIFSDYYEMHWALLLCGALFTILCAADRKSTPGQWRWLAVGLTFAMFAGVDALLAWAGRKYPDLIGQQVPFMRVIWWSVMGVIVVLWLARGQHRTFQHWRLMACFWLTLGLIALGTALWFQTQDFGERVIARSRNFYGTMKVCEYRKDDPQEHYYLLDHGRISHGLQFVYPEYAAWATTYYGDESGLARGIAALPGGPRRIGMVGLGTGTVAVFGRPGDYLRIYEINPEVVRLAGSRFSYLSNSRAQVEIVLGDARLALDNEPSQNFDLLALDAFNSDAIPVHLLTREAFELYSRHVKTNGVIAVHISNRYLDLQPVIRNVAKEFNFKLAIIDFEEDETGEDGEGEWWVYSSTWALLTRNEEILNRPDIQDFVNEASTNAPVIPLWTDDFASIFQILE